MNLCPKGIKYNCEECSFVTKDAVCLRRHVQSKHREAQFVCTKCHYATTQDYTLKAHMEREHGGVKGWISIQYSFIIRS